MDSIQRRELYVKLETITYKQVTGKKLGLNYFLKLLSKFVIFSQIFDQFEALHKVLRQCM